MSTAAQLIANSVAVGASYAMLGVSFALVYNTTRFFHFAHGVVYATAAYVAYVAASAWRLSFLKAVIISAAAGALLGLVMDRTLYLPLRKKKTGPVGLLLASLGLFILLQNILSLTFGDAVLVTPHLTTATESSIGGALVAESQRRAIWAACIALPGLFLVLRFTKLGRSLRAISSDSELATIIGIDANWTISIAFLIASALAGIAGYIAAADTGLRPTMGFNALLVAVVAFVIGGVGSVWGAGFAAFVIATLQQVSVWILPSKWQDAVVFTALVLVLLFKPEGFHGYFVKKASL